MPETGKISEVLLRWEELRRLGRNVPAEELCRGCPEQLPEVRRQIEALGAIYRVVDTSPLKTAEAASLKAGQEKADPFATVKSVGPADSNAVGSADLWPAVPGYEIMAELGRGGMGVVYKARHFSLNRLVALKMIRSGSHADLPELLRFRAEAEAVAHLQHPNIVQIFEVGEHQGLPYFALEFVEGGSLDKNLKGGLLAPRQAAQIVGTVAQAIHSAHQKGIVHRDLKPANILMQKSEIRSQKLEEKTTTATLATNFCLLTSDFFPKITDFGLAKRIDADQGQTQTGAVMGTPSYMAPEQALGRTREVGPAVDIYALGAILYELLTGRPPFKGATEWDTLQMVIEAEPVPPSRLQAKVPRDLETICLKCLEKSPTRRYGSASELAEDLQRFLAGEPIRARPVSVAGRLGRWCRRNPALATVSAAALLLLVGSFIGLTGLYLRAEQQRRQAERAQKQADEERERAKTAAADAQHQKKVAEGQRLAARDQAERSHQVTRFLIGMFEVSDPLGLNGFAFGLSTTGEKLTALDLLDRGAKRASSDQNMKPQVKADIMGTVGNVYRSMGRYKEAEALLKQALVIRQRSGATEGEIAASLHALGWLHHERGNYAVAQKLYRDALALRLRQNEPDLAEVANCKLNLAWLLTEMEDYAQAEKLLKEAINLRTNLFGEDNRETALAKAGLAALYFDSHRPLEALPLMLEVMATLRKFEGDKSVWQGAMLFQQAMGQSMVSLAAAEKTLHRSQDLIRHSLGPKHIYVTMPMVQRALTLEQLGRKGEAEQLYREALDIARERVGLAHPKVLILAAGLARIRPEREPGNRIDALFEEMLIAHRERFGRDHPFVADVLCEYSEHLWRCRQYARQEEVDQAAVRIYRSAEGFPCRRFPRCLLSLAATRYRAGNYPASEPYYREALAVARKRHPKTHPDLVTCLEALASALLRQGKLASEANDLLTEAELMLPKLAADARRAVQHPVVMTRCEYLRVKDGKHAEVAAVLRVYRKEMPADAGRFQDMAFQFVNCLSLVAKDRSLDGAEKQRLHDLYGAEAVAMFRRAWVLGIPEADRWENNKVLQPLKKRKDFQGLVAEVGKQKAKVSAAR